MPTGEMVVIDASIVEGCRLRRAVYSHNEMAGEDHLGLAFETYKKIQAGQPIRIGTARKVMEALGFRCLEDILSPESREEYQEKLGQMPTAAPEALSFGWLKGDKLGDALDVANGLRIEAYRLYQRGMPRRAARGKRYDLSGMALADRYRSDEFLQRHTRICDMLKKCPYVADNLMNVADADRDGWWVVDQWYRGPTLAKMIEEQFLAAEQLPAIMQQIIQGIEAIHDAGVIGRELTPEKVIYDYSDESIVLTDFEMGKLFDNSPTVRGCRWPTNPYRAPEAEGVDLRKEDHHVDLYSWGRIVLHAVTGNDNTKQGNEAEALDSVDLPKKVRDTLLKCVDLDRRNRPKSAAAVLRAISNWK